MKTLDEVLLIVEGQIDRPTLESFMSRDWLRPPMGEFGPYFEDVDVSRLNLVLYLQQVINVNQDGIDVVLSLVDQLYTLRQQTQKLQTSLLQLPTLTRDEVFEHLRQDNP
ncbi:MAG: chaperone modulator CbpM [bacterium]|nr:chaperone modulator CbpM [bacterium]